MGSRLHPALHDMYATRDKRSLTCLCAGKTKENVLLCILPVHQRWESPVNHYHSNPQR